MNCEQIFHGQKKIFHYAFRKKYIKSVLFTKIEENREIECEDDMVHSNKFNIKLLVTKKETISRRRLPQVLLIVSFCFDKKWQEMTRNNISPL